MLQKCSNKCVGVIGGFGPETTAEFYLQIIFGYKKAGVANRPHIIISNPGNPIEFENDFIGKNSSTERFVPILTETAQELERAGADFIVLPCNSLHKFIEEIRASVSVPVLSIVEETCKYIKSQKFAKTGLISTAATVENRVYEVKFEENNINFAVPNGLHRAEMNKIIQRLVDGEHLNKDREKILEIIKDLKDNENIDAIALACTDLQLLLPEDDHVTVFDTMKILADSVVGELLK
ncbi:aspartate racemase [Clostridia bacterium]|nr:aspartate racemase [Clostridia bacterium]